MNLVIVFLGLVGLMLTYSCTIEDCMPDSDTKLNCDTYTELLGCYDKQLKMCNATSPAKTVLETSKAGAVKAKGLLKCSSASISVSMATLIICLVGLALKN